MSEEKKADELIVKVPGICGGDATIRGKRIAVEHVIRMCRHHGWNLQVTQGKEFPHLTEAEMVAAVDYYFEHPEEISASITADDRYWYLRGGWPRRDE